MNTRPVPIFVASLVVCVTGCGGASPTSGITSSSATQSAPSATSPSTVPAAPLETRIDHDHDNDVGAPEDDASNSAALSPGQEASKSDKHMLKALLKRYYEAAAAENGAAACAMLYRPLANSVVQDYGKPPGPVYMRGSTCASAMKLLFKHFHPQIVLELPSSQSVKCT